MNKVMFEGLSQVGTGQAQSSSFQNMLSVDARLKKNLQAQLLMKVSGPSFLVKAEDGLPLMLLVIFKCLYNESAECELTLIQVASSLEVSPATITNWRKKIEASDLVSCKRNRGSITFYLCDELAQYMKISETCLDDEQFNDQQSKRLNSDLISSLLTRVDRLEEALYKVRFGGGQV